MQIILIILGYIKWHYGKSLLSLTKVWRNFLYFILDFFSMKLLFRNFFDPWKRMADNYPKNFNLKKYLYVLITNIIVRVVGIMMRTILIITGLSCYILLILFYPIVLSIWLVLPFIVIILIGLGINLIIK